MSARAVKKYRVIISLLLITGYIFTMTGGLWGSANAQDIATDINAAKPLLSGTQLVEEINPYFSIEHTSFADGTPVSGYIIHGPPNPLPEYEAERLASIRSTTAAVILPDFPSFNWVFGCSAVSGAMIAGYYDRGAYPNMYAGPTNGGVMPLTDTSWPTWTDVAGDPYPNNPLIASHLGVDGLAVKGSIDDYWIQYGSMANDPYITGGWIQHTWETAIGDFMKTSQSANPYSNSDGSTTFYNWTDDSAQLTCSTMIDEGIDDEDGTYGRKLFYEARGYTVTDCYNQNTDNNVAGGFSLANFQAEINAGHPVLLNLEGHSIVGYGYDGSTIYIRDTWDNNPANTYTMPWGDSYEGMELLSVSVVHLAPQVANRSYVPLVLKGIIANQSPTDILLSNSSIAEGLPINTVVGLLTSTDPNVGDTFTYSLVSGAGDTGNTSFNILGNQLRSSIIFDYETQNSYSIRVRSTDQGGLYYENVFTITITMAAVNPILNGGFESGHVAWTEYSSHGWDIINLESVVTVPAHSGDWMAWLGGGNNETSRLSQAVTVPSSMSYLHYWYWIGSEDDCGWDYFRIKVNGSTVYSRDLCYEQNTYGWVEAVLNLSAYANSTITLMFEATTDVSYSSDVLLDDISFSSTAAVSPDVLTPGSVELEAGMKER